MFPTEILHSERWSTIKKTNQHSKREQPWTPKEDAILIKSIQNVTSGGSTKDLFPRGVDWGSIADALGRTPYECVARYGTIGDSESHFDDTIQPQISQEPVFNSYINTSSPTKSDLASPTFTPECLYSPPPFASRSPAPRVKFNSTVQTPFRNVDTNSEKNGQKKHLSPINTKVEEEYKYYSLEKSIIKRSSSTESLDDRFDHLLGASGNRSSHHIIESPLTSPHLPAFLPPTPVVASQGFGDTSAFSLSDDPFEATSMTRSTLEEAFLDMAGSKLDASR